MAQTEYKRLTRATPRARFAAVRTPSGSLWLGADHLLSVESNGYTEHYKRFYFRDIQAITIQKTVRWQVWNFILGALAIIFVILLLATRPAGSPASWGDNEIAGGIVLSTFTVLFAALFLINLFLGATCKCYLRTAVQIEELPSLRRIRQTRKILAKIRPLIAAAQGGELTPEIIAEKMREQIQSPVETAATMVENPIAPPKLDS